MSQSIKERRSRRPSTPPSVVFEFLRPLAGFVDHFDRPGGASSSSFAPAMKPSDDNGGRVGGHGSGGGENERKALVDLSDAFGEVDTADVQPQFDDDAEDKEEDDRVVWLDVSGGKIVVEEEEAAEESGDPSSPLVRGLDFLNVRATADPMTKNRWARRAAALVFAMAMSLVAVVVFSKTPPKPRRSPSSSSGSSSLPGSPSPPDGDGTAVGGGTNLPEGASCESGFDDDVDLSTIVETIGDDPESWCRKDKPECDCVNPVVPQEFVADESAKLVRRWRINSHLSNVRDANDAASAHAKKDDLDVVFLGDSIVERWNGEYHDSYFEEYRSIVDVFGAFFTKGGGGRFEGLALGIFNDRTPQLLWRIQNGEAPPLLNPKVWWIVVGTNDLSGDGCSTSAVLAGTIRIAEELRSRKPNATVVLNGILPRTSSPDLTTTTTAAQINDRLSCYGRSNDRIEFHDSTDAFLDDSTGTGEIDPSLYDDDGVHPSLRGYLLWAESIASKLKELM